MDKRVHSFEDVPVIFLNIRLISGVGDVFMPDSFSMFLKHFGEFLVAFERLWCGCGSPLTLSSFKLTDELNPKLVSIQEVLHEYFELDGEIRNATEILKNKKTSQHSSDNGADVGSQSSEITTDVIEM